MYYGTTISSKSLYQILNKIDTLTSNFGAQIPPMVNDRNGFPSVLQPTIIIKLNNWICIINYQRLIYIKNIPTMYVTTSFNQIKKTSFGPLGKRDVVCSE